MKTHPFYPRPGNSFPVGRKKTAAGGRTPQRLAFAAGFDSNAFKRGVQDFSAQEAVFFLPAVGVFEALLQ